MDTPSFERQETLIEWGWLLVAPLSAKQRAALERARERVLAVLALAGTTAFILARKQLLLRRPRASPSERVAAANVAACLIVLLGMATTWVLLFGLTLGAGFFLWPQELIARWAPAVGDAAGLGRLCALAGLVATLGLVVGSLGASFEGNHYFHHVIYADEET